MAAQQISAFSFCYAPPASSDFTAYNASLDDTTRHEAIMSDLRDTCNNVMARHGCQIALAAAPELASIKPQASLVDTPTDYNPTLTGPLTSVMAARGELLANCPLKINVTLKVPLKEWPINSTVIRSELDKIEVETDTQITVSPPSAPRSAYASEMRVAVVITGLPDNAEYARVRVLVALDEHSNLRSDILRVPLKLHNLICGRKRAGLQPIVEETATNIYFPSPFATTSSLSAIEEAMEKATLTESSGTPLMEEFSPPIYITGEAVNVSRVKDMLSKLAVQKAKSMYHKDAALHARKLEWMLLHRRDELRKIMHDNGSYIAFPQLGSGANTITVYAENRVNAERTLRSLNFLACSIYEAYFYFNNRDSTIYGPDGGVHNFFSTMNNVIGLVSQLSQVSGAEVTYKSESGCVEVLGTERAVRNVYQRLHEMPFLKMFHQNTIFDVELSNDQREFISGKKSGKINKIMKTSGAKIKFLPFSDYNFIIEVESTSFTKALDGLTMLQEELPAEISFYVPEVYHKRIIGVGGKNIQRIMKKYGVYVKFSNAEEFASLGGYYDNDDNVVARTPMKNQVNLDNLRHAVMELIVQRDKNFITKTTNIPFRIHRELLREHNSYFAEVTKKTNTRILWPDHELASDTVTFVGPSTQIDQAMHMVLSVVPDVYELRVPRSAALTAALVSESFQELVVSRLEREFGIQVDIETTPPSPPSMSSSSPSPNNTPVTENANATSAAPAAIGPSTSSTANASPKSPTHSTPGQSSPAAVHRSDYVIPLKMNRAMHEYLAPAKSILVDYLATHNVAVYDSATPKASRTTPTTATRSASSASLVDSFSHFSNKVLPSVSDISPPKLHHHNSFTSFSLFDFAPSSSTSTSSVGGTHSAFDGPWGTFRDMNSPRTAENIRAIFDSPMDQRPSGSGATTPGGGAPGLSVFRSGVNGTPSSIGGPGNLDIWLPQMPLMNHSATTSASSFGLRGTSAGTSAHSAKSSMIFGNGNEAASGGASFYQPYPGTDFQPTNHQHQHQSSTIFPTSSTSTGSNTSLHSTHSIPESENDLRHVGRQQQKRC